ncbi:MAG: penicillin-binding protein 2 [Acidimicrobiia bacterium]|nr:penicillin-binding protein 2 [Acidimicrobiia bacterium]MDH3396809.1 penicillin-binding protein 2 [Acidimicrobiia bacterium]MDH5616066.1 penicillin-binding protein 2 [Acidimicrobiia bacterium]
MKLSWRLTWMVLVFVVMFAVLFTRLWFVQIAAGETYDRQAGNQNVRIDPTLAPRGNIIDRDGIPLATSSLEPWIVVDRKQIPLEDEERVIQQLSGLLELAAVEVSAAFENAGSGSRFLLAAVDAGIEFYVLEHQDDLPGVGIEEVPVRRYPQSDVMAHVLGHIGRPSPGDLEENPKLDPNSTVGKSGVERSFDAFLQGTAGFLANQVNAVGKVLKPLGGEPARAGATLQLTTDIDTQKVLEDALAEGVRLANRVKVATGSYTNFAERSAGLVIDVTDGSILAMGSYPDFDPEVFVSGLTQREFDELLERKVFSNLAIQALYPPASTFKAITYTTALEERLFPEGAVSANDLIECSARLNAPFTDASQLVWRNWTWPNADGYQDLHTAFERSCNIYFWQIALRIWNDFKGTEREDVIQDWARAVGMGERTGIDLPYEAQGIVPDRDLFDLWAKEQPWRVRDEGWLGGDLMQTAVGQGAVLSTPLQLATAYATLVNGGTFWQPRVVQRVFDADGQLVEEYQPVAVRNVGITPAATQSLLADMRRVTTAGTAATAFSDMGADAFRVGGKTGTAQMGQECEGVGEARICKDRDNTAWFAGVAPIDSPRYVVVVVVEEGGSGGRVAAPVARHIMQYLLGLEPTDIVDPRVEGD